MTPVIKIAKPGFSVDTALPYQLAFDSELDVIKIAYSAAPSSNGTYTHSLGITPAFFASTKFSTTKYEFIGQQNGAISSYEVTFYSTSTQFIYWDACRYFLFYQDTL